MRYRLFLHTLALSTAAACAQENSIPSLNLVPTPPITFSSTAESDGPSQLPDAPSATSAAPPSDVVVIAQSSFRKDGVHRDCNVLRAMKMVSYNPDQPDKVPPPCIELVDPYQRFLSTDVVIPLTWQQKGLLALHQWIDPSNLMTIAGVSAISIAADAHTAYGPGFKGWATLTGVSLAQDATGEFFGNFVIPSLTHQDPRYYRVPNKSIPRRIGHAIAQTYVAYGDNGHRMPNYGVLVTYPIAVEISNFYVPGIETDARSTTRRIFVGYALEPTNNLITEFVPDLAKRVHIRIIFVQKILNNIAVTPAGPTP